MVLRFIDKIIGENVSEDDSDGEEEDEDDPSTASRFEQIFNERSNILVSVSKSKEGDEPENSESNNNPSNPKKPRKQNKKCTQLNFDLACLGILEREVSNRLKMKLNMKCTDHFDEIDRDCFECSLINIIP